MKHSEILIIQKNTGHDAREKKTKKQEMKREEAIEINRENMHMLYVCMYANPNFENVGTCWEN